MVKNESLKKFPHDHLLGIEGLTPPDLNYLLDLSDHFAKYLDKENTDNNVLKAIILPARAESQPRTSAITYDVPAVGTPKKINVIIA